MTVPAASSCPNALRPPERAVQLVALRTSVAPSREGLEGATQTPDVLTSRGAGDTTVPVVWSVTASHTLAPHSAPPSPPLQVKDLADKIGACRPTISKVLHGAYPPCQLPTQAPFVHVDFEFRVSSLYRCARERYDRDGEHGCRNPTTDLVPPCAFPPHSQPGDVRREQAMRLPVLEARPR